MKPIKFIYHGFEVQTNEHWTEEDEAFLIGERTVVKYYGDEELLIYNFPNSLKGKETVDYYPVDARVRRYSIFFDNFPTLQTFDLNMSLAEIIEQLTLEK
ncbi:hypothetical protein ABLO26_03630 [Neobacillus sp. 179-J 1A1 HS]|uniref:hypothetical protein n=1 Tax=Neobacillus driksii TaxID=3035913 RepID=UPI0035BBEF1E